MEVQWGEGWWDKQVPCTGTSHLVGALGCAGCPEEDAGQRDRCVPRRVQARK